MAVQRIEQGIAAVLDASAAPVREASNFLVSQAAPSWQSVYRRSLATVDVFTCAGVMLMLVGMMTPLWALVFAITSAFAFAVLSLILGGYDTPRIGVGARQFGVGLRISAVWILLITTAFYLFDHTVSPYLLVGAFLMVATVSQSARALARALVVRGHQRGRFLTNTVIIGDEESATHLREHLGADAGCRVVGVCTLEPHGGAGPTGDDRISPPPGEEFPGAVDLIVSTGARLVVVAGKSVSSGAVRRFGWELEAHDVELILAPNLDDTAPTRLDLRCAAGTPLINVSLHPSPHRVLLKGTFDRVLGALLLAAVSLPLIALYLLVRLTSKGPGFFVQERVGANGRKFRMYKLRTMYLDAEDRRAELLAANEGNDVMFKMREDPRITPVGKKLRRYSLDELPQLLNVVRGDMSLVGPRPPLIEEVNGYTLEAMRRLKVKPGLTGLWQVSGRSDLDWDETVRLDLSYVDNWSTRLDLLILLRTFRAVVSGRGAY